MSEPFIGEIIMFGGNFAPRGWALCNGQLLPISQNTALFSILGTTYGGDGRTTFGLPDLRGRVPMHPGNGPGLTPRRLGSSGGAEANTLSDNQLPAHEHTLPIASSAEGDSNDPAGRVLGRTDDRIYTAQGSATELGAQTNAAGAGQPVDNLQPYQCVNFIIALVGVFPSRS